MVQRARTRRAGMTTRVLQGQNVQINQPQNQGLLNRMKNSGAVKAGGIAAIVLAMGAAGALVDNPYFQFFAYAGVGGFMGYYSNRPNAAGKHLRILLMQKFHLSWLPKVRKKKMRPGFQDL